MREGTLFEFSSADEAIAAATALRVLGFTDLDSYTPYPLPELDDTLGIRRTRIPRAVLVAAAFGCALAFAIIWGTNVFDYPLDVGGRPLDSLPADIPIMFETTVLLGALTAFALVFLRSGLPRLHRPIFAVEGIESASVDHFWIGIARREPIDEAVCAQMKTMGALAIRTMGERRS